MDETLKDGRSDIFIHLLVKTKDNKLNFVLVNENLLLLDFRHHKTDSYPPIVTPTNKLLSCRYENDEKNCINVNRYERTAPSFGSFKLHDYKEATVKFEIRKLWRHSQT